MTDDKTRNDYKKILTEIIQQQMLVLGDGVAVERARKVPGIKIDEQGRVIELIADPELVVRAVIDEYLTLAGQIAQITIARLAKKYPGVINI